MKFFILILLIIALIIGINIKKNINREIDINTKELINIYDKYIKKEENIENKRIERVNKIVNKYSYKLILLKRLNNKFFSKYNKIIKKNCQFSEKKYFRDKRSYDRASTYDYFLKNKDKMIEAIKYKTEVNYYIDNYFKIYYKIINFKTPDWIYEFFEIDKNEFIKKENEFFSLGSIERSRYYIYDKVTCNVYFSYTSPAGRNHYHQEQVYTDNDIYSIDSPFKYNFENLEIDYSYDFKEQKFKQTIDNEDIKITVDESNNTPTIEIGKYENQVTDFIYKYQYKNRADIRKIVIPDNIKCISSFSFEGCINLKEVVIESNEIVIEDYAFLGCYNLKKIQSIGKIEYSNTSFFGCSSLEL